MVLSNTNLSSSLLKFHSLGGVKDSKNDTYFTVILK